MPRKKKSDNEQKEVEEKKPKKKTSSKEKFIDPNSIIDEYIDEIVNALGLAYLNLTRDEYKEMLKEPFAAAVGEVKTKPKSKTIIGRLQANRDSLMEFLAIKLLRLLDLNKMSNEQFEFVVYNIKSAVKDLGPRLYEEALKRNRQDLIDILRSTWATYGINSPVECPKCKFNAIMPDLTCYICKYTISMRQLKEQIRAIDLLIDLSKYDQASFKEILSAGYFYYSWNGVSPPSKMPKNDPLVFEVVLNKEEKEKLKSYYSAGNTQPRQ